MRVLCYELNEVPWRVLDDHVRARPGSAIARLLAAGASYTTRAPDEGHLSPWITWPTMHRGVPNTEHGVAFLGQDPASYRHDPLWRVAHRAGRTIGVFGALQSWPPEPLAGRGFHVPDTFAPDARCEPERLSAFQAFNLENVRESGRVVNANVGAGRTLKAALTLPSLGVRTATMAAGGLQLLGERRDARRRYRRAAFQSILGFDVFLREYRRARPDYASFFTNHVAGLMHRYWRAAYPGDYADGLGGDDPYYAEAIPWAMDVAAAHVGALMRIADRDPDTVVVVASSMGQHAIRPTDDKRTWKVADVGALLRALGYEGPWERRFAMEPQLPVAFPDAAAAAAFERAAALVTDTEGASVLRTDRVDETVSITLKPTEHALDEGALVVAGSKGKAMLRLADLGIEVLEPDTPGTAYHVPEGSLVLYGRRVRNDPGRREVSTLSYAPTLLDLLGVDRPAAMTAPSLAPEVLTAR